MFGNFPNIKTMQRFSTVIKKKSCISYQIVRDLKKNRSHVWRVLDEEPDQFSFVTIKMMVGLHQAAFYECHSSFNPNL